MPEWTVSVNLPAGLDLSPDDLKVIEEGVSRDVALWWQQRTDEMIAEMIHGRAQVSEPVGLMAALNRPRTPPPSRGLLVPYGRQVYFVNLEAAGLPPLGNAAPDEPGAGASSTAPAGGISEGRE